jgi:threonine 3-dehydrogenase
MNIFRYKTNYKSFVYLGSDHGKKFLITGSNGQIGRGFRSYLYSRYGMSNVIISDISDPTEKIEGKFYKLDVTDKEKFNQLVKENKITQIIHLASLLSASCEMNVELAMKINIEGMHNALNVARDNKCSIFIPSTIATFGSNLDKKPIPDDFIQNPITFYGIGKIYQEKLGSYYNKKFALDFRCLRYPAIISPYRYAGNGSASYPTELIHAVLENRPYQMFLDSELELPMMYIDDCIRGTVELIEAGNSNLSRRVYNFNGLSFTPKQYINTLRKIINIQNVEYNIDPLRNEIAKSWPVSLDDQIANRDWGWKSQYDTTKKLVNKLVMDITKVKI